MSDAPHGHNCGTCRWFVPGPTPMAACFRYPQDVETRADSYCGEWTETVEAESADRLRQLERLKRRLAYEPSGRLL